LETRTIRPEFCLGADAVTERPPAASIKSTNCVTSKGALKALHRTRLEAEKLWFNLRIGTPPVGAEHPSKSSGKSGVTTCGAAESAAVDAELAIVIDAWKG
jgi:hypothetical protein